MLISPINAHYSVQVHSVAWNCDGTKLASGSYDKTVTLWSLDADKLVGFSQPYTHVA